MSHFENYPAELLQLDQSIARHAIACGADLARPEVLESVAKGDFSLCEHPHNPACRELQGLLVLRYKVRAECAGTIGGDACQDLLDQTDETLTREGFAPRSSGN
ncbi:MAG TPA: hypothetical protein VI279_05730 [Rhodocyclaceae bacterium]